MNIAQLKKYFPSFVRFGYERETIRRAMAEKYSQPAQYRIVGNVVCIFFLPINEKRSETSDYEFPLANFAFCISTQPRNKDFYLCTLYPDLKHRRFSKPNFTKKINTKMNLLILVLKIIYVF